MKRLRTPLSASNRNSSDELTAEALEPRILYSAGPVEVPSVDASVQEVTAQPEVATAPAQVEEKVTPAAEPVASEAGAGELSVDQQIDLVAIDAQAAALNQETVEILAAEARQRWIDAGISEGQIAALDAVEYSIADVGGAHLGVASGSRITIDDDAGGTGIDNWFIDATPGADEEFAATNSDIAFFAADGSSIAQGKFDLLTTLIHEQGHVLGLFDQDNSSVSEASVMNGLLRDGVRLVPHFGQAEGATPGAVVGDAFLTADIARASTAADGTGGNGGSNTSAISADGRYLAFLSISDNLVSGDTNAKRDAFVKDLVTGEVVRVNTDSNGNEANSNALDVTISADGKFAAFSTGANNLVEDDTNSRVDIFRKDLTTGELIRVNVDADGIQADNHSFGVSLSGDGRKVVFTSEATNLSTVDDNNKKRDVYLKDIKTGKVTLVSSHKNGTQGDGLSTDAVISEDGKHVAFESVAENLIDDDNNGHRDVFVVNIKTGAVTRVSTDKDGVGGESHSAGAAISADGRYVAFHSIAGNLIDGDTNGFQDVFVKDTKTGAIELASAAANGAQLNGDSSDVSISADGEVVAFSTDDSSLPASNVDSNGVSDIAVKVLNGSGTGDISLVSTDADGNTVAGASAAAMISGDGRYVAFESDGVFSATDSNGVKDIFAKGLAPLVQDHNISIEGSNDEALTISQHGDVAYADDITVEVVEGTVIVKSAKGTSLGSSIVGAEQVSDREIRIPGSVVGRLPINDDFLIDTGDGDDIIRLGNIMAGTGSTSVVVAGGLGNDLIKLTGTLENVGGASETEMRLEAEQIRLERNSAVIASGETDIVLDAGFSTNDAGSDSKQVGVRARNATINSFNGSIFIVGQGGGVGSGNHGIDMAGTEITTNGDTTAGIDLEGIGGGTTDSGNNDGVVLGKGTLLQTGGLANINLYGLGGGGVGGDPGAGSGNQGIVIANGVNLRTVGSDGNSNGSISLYGVGGNAKSANSGVQIGNGLIETGEGGSISIAGEGGGTGSNNLGVKLTGTTLIGTGDVRVDGFTFGDLSGSNNRGVNAESVDVLQIGSGEIRINGSTSGGKNSNEGVRITNSVLESADNSVFVYAENSSTTTGNGNRGVFISGSQLTAGENIEIDSEGAAGKSSNVGIEIRKTDIVSDVDFRADAEVSEETTGAGNRGFFMKSGTVSSGQDIRIDGYAGGGTSNNEGVHISGVIMNAEGDGTFVGEGASGRITTGSKNNGIYVNQSTLSLQGEVEVFGMTDGGTNSNVGVHLNKTDISAELIGDDGEKLSISGTSRITTGSSNRGVYINGGSLIGAEIEVHGDAGESAGRNFNDGVYINSATITSTGIAGTLSLSGESSSDTSGSNNQGIRAGNSTLISNSDLSIEGYGGNGVNSNVGVSLHSTDVSSSGNVQIDAYAYDETTGNKNRGLQINGGSVAGIGSLTIQAGGGLGEDFNQGAYLSGVTVSGADAINVAMMIEANADRDTTGTSNHGLYLKKTEIVSDNVTTLTGRAGGGTDSNRGIEMISSSVVSDSNLIVVGSSREHPTGKNNDGVYLNSVTLETEGYLGVTGQGGDGTNNNNGLYVDGGSITSTDDSVDLVGTAGTDVSGKANRGVFLNKTAVSATIGRVTVFGDAGGGTDDNQAVRVVGGSLSSANFLQLFGTVEGATNGKNNIGVFLFNGVALSSDSPITLEGSGGGGTAMNHGIYMHKNISVTGGSATFDGTAGTGDDSEDEAGDFFDSQGA